MALNYSTLIAAKGTPGSITDWVGYGKIAVQADTILTEAQALIYQALRVREMRLQWIFGVAAGSCRVALPQRFLDPIGRLTDNFGQEYRHLTEEDVKRARMFDSRAATSSITTINIQSGATTPTAVTAIDESATIPNGTVVTRIGMYQTTAKTVTLKIAKKNSAGNYDIVVSQSFAHPGGGWADVTLSSPYAVPATGSYYLAAWSSGTSDTVLGLVVGAYVLTTDVTGVGQVFTEAASGGTWALRYAPSGSLINNPFTTGAIGSGIITAAFPNHTLNEGSDVTVTGSNDVDGITINGTHFVRAIIDANTLQFTVLDGAAIAGSVTGGGGAAVYTANNLIAGYPTQWSVWDEYLQFDGAFSQATQFRLMCFKSLPLLSAANQTNFLTNRYPMILRKACQAAAADFMKDDNEYTKATSALASLIQATNAESDLMYRGADLYTETP